MPSESELSAAYEASRVTIRKALELLRDEGLVDARQGFGWFAAIDPLRQSLGRLGTIESQLAESGVRSERRVLDFGFVAAPPRVRQVLGVDDRARGAPAQPGRRRAVRPGHGVVPGGAGRPPLAGRRRAGPLLRPVDQPLGGAVQTIGAAVADARDAALLEVPVGSPVLRCERTTSDPDGRPVLVSEHVFPAHRTEFVVDLPLAEPSIAARGLRLVE